MALAGVILDGDGWEDAASDWRAPFLPAGAADWIGFPAMEDLFLYNGSGVMTGRTWVISPDAQSLRDRWKRLVDEKDAAKKAVLFHPPLRSGKPGDKHVNKIVEKALGNYRHSPLSVSSDQGAGLPPQMYAFRSF